MSQRPASLPPPDQRALDRAAELTRAASRPIVIAGLQCGGPGQASWLLAFAEALPAPVLTTSQARGAFPEEHPLALGIFTGSASDGAVVGLADLVVMLGLEPEELTLRHWPISAPVVHLGRTPHGGHAVAPLVEVVGDLAAILEELAPRVRGKTQADWDMFGIHRLKMAQRG